jgi:hypothetical protein
MLLDDPDLTVEALRGLRILGPWNIVTRAQGVVDPVGSRGDILDPLHYVFGVLLSNDRSSWCWEHWDRGELVVRSTGHATMEDAQRSADDAAVRVGWALAGGRV